MSRFKNFAICLEEKYKSRILNAAAGYDLIVVDAQDFTAAEIKKLKAGGGKVLSYLNVGAIEKDRSYFSAAKRDDLILGPYDNWEDEYWVAAQSPKWKSIILGLAATLHAKGIDGFWCDNLDILYTAEEEYKWDKSKTDALYKNLQEILAGLHKLGYVMLNGADVFVSRSIKAKQAGCFDGVTQETVITCIKDYDAPGKFGRQSADEREYYTDYLAEVRMAEKDICLLEYATDPAIIEDAEAFARAKGYTLCVSGNIELGGDIMQKGITNLDIAVMAVDVLLGKYKKGDVRKKKLGANYTVVQAEVDRIFNNKALWSFDVAVYIIAGKAGRGEAVRRAKLGKYYAEGQKRVNRIWGYKGKKTAEVVKLVRAGEFGSDAVRRLLLRFCGYDVETVQEAVNKAIAAEKAAKKPSQDTEVKPGKKYRLYAPRFWDNNPENYGDVSCFIEYADDGKTIEHVVLVDTGMNGTNTIKKLQGVGVTTIDALIISHDHGDHYGLTKKIIEKFKVLHVYLPPQDGVRKYQKTCAKRMDDLAEYCRKLKGHETPTTFYKVGDRITAGTMRFDCIFQANAADLPEHESHHFINNMSAVIKATCGAWTTLLAGDLSADGIRQMLAKGINVACDIFKILWHGDRGAIITKPNFAEKMRMIVAYCQYHDHEGKGNGRKLTYEILRKAGAFVVRSYEDGEIDMIMQDKNLTVTTSSGIKKVFTKK